jgi:hypothetical protein
MRLLRGSYQAPNWSWRGSHFIATPTSRPPEDRKPEGDALRVRHLAQAERGGDTVAIGPRRDGADDHPVARIRGSW